MRITIKKVLLILIAIWTLIIMGSGSADTLINIYNNYSQHWIAGAIICLSSGFVIILFPLLFIIEDTWFEDKLSLKALTLFAFIIGVLSPIIFGFNSLGLIISILLIFTTLITVEKITKSISELKKKVDEQEY